MGGNIAYPTDGVVWGQGLDGRSNAVNARTGDGKLYAIIVAYWLLGWRDTPRQPGATVCLTPHKATEISTSPT